jgi:hypothetical protein
MSLTGHRRFSTVLVPAGQLPVSVGVEASEEREFPKSFAKTLIDRL